MTLITGHRGARNLWPENSLEGFSNVLALRVDAVEFDVHMTDAGELIIIHDATLERTTEGRGPVRAISPEARRTTRLKHSDETLPTLADVLDVLVPADLPLHVELKNDEAGDPYDGIVAKVTTQLFDRGLAQRSYLTSFDVSVLKECRRVAPGIKRLVSVNTASAERHGGLSRFIETVDELVEIVAVHHDLLEAEWALITDLLPLERLCVWTLNDEAMIAKWLERGIGHLTSDNPDKAIRLRQTFASAA
ncbi:glycerophosphodiester phosphodiesterase [Rhizobium sp. NTR19]|uniref:Glycerophosphodiester phosphodiesterase n=1 Tax=Neorhizobium turbinariae TaxID=2937795 RepID=A0ABT0IWV1_9HYPH|nr:glycerophosphodiester phosphodiesterase family protein [Neorhizobium turbinariae]MCK8782315.1 glycerophosphodiester phosphodiesterase [Neorhizobium turbinariae]